MAEVRLIEAHRHVVVTGKWHREFRPLRCRCRDACSRKAAMHVEPHAVDMDVQLILRARVHRIDRQPDRIARQRAMRTLLDVATRLPGVLPVVGRVRRENRGAFDAADPRGRDQQELRIRRRCPSAPRSRRRDRPVRTASASGSASHPERIAHPRSATAHSASAAAARGVCKVNRAARIKAATTPAHHQADVHPRRPPSCRSLNP